MADTDVALYSDGDNVYHAPLFDVGNGLYSLENLDKSTQSVQMIEYSHHEIHSGNHYYISGHTTLADTDAFLYVKLVTPDSAKWAHFRWEINSTGALITELYEGAAGGMAGGDSVTPINNNRNSTDASGITITKGVAAATDDGTLIDSASWGSTGKFTESGGGAGRDDEIILKQNTTYLRKFISEGDANVVSFRASWYEHIDAA